MFGEDFIQKALLGLPILFFSLTVHEFSHAWSAFKFGDSTARDMGRMTLNPLAHLSLMGTIVMVISQFTFGWAKPVPVNPFNLRNRRVAHFWISAAGPISNLIIAFFAGNVLRMMGGLHGAGAAGHFLYTAVLINVVLAVFNLMPLFPLDGSHMLRNILPREYEETFEKFDRIAPFILLFLIFMGPLWIILGPVVYSLVYLFAGV